MCHSIALTLYLITPLDCYGFRLIPRHYHLVPTAAMCWLLSIYMGHEHTGCTLLPYVDTDWLVTWLSTSCLFAASRTYT